MQAYRRYVGTAIAFALSLSAGAADAAVTVQIVQPSNVFIEGDTIPVRVAAQAPDDVYYVEAEFEGIVIELTPTEDGTFEGSFDLGELGGDLPYGPHVVTVDAYSTLGEMATAQRTLHRYAPPTLGWNVLPNDTLTAGVRFDAKCIPTPPYECQRLSAEFRSPADVGRANVVINFLTTAPQELQSSHPERLYIKEDRWGNPVVYQLPSGRTYTLTIEASDGVGPTVTRTVGPIHVDRSPRLTVVERAPGAILDFDATRLLVLNDRGRIGIVERATRAVTWIETMPAGDAPLSAVYGALMPSGAVYQTTNGYVRSWINGVRSTVGRAARLDAVNGDTAVWTSDSDDWAHAHDSSTGDNTTLWFSWGSRSPFQADITASGEIYFGTYEGASIVGPGGALLGDHEGNLQRPITDGTNVVGRWWDGRTSSSYLYTADGEEVFLGDSITGASAGLLAHAGHAGFLKSNGAVNQVWLRTPDGEQHQISDFATSSQFDQAKLRVGHDGLSDTGDVLFLNGGKRYIGRPGGAPEVISSDLGHGRWLDGSWHVTIGNTLAQVTSAAGSPALLAAPANLAGALEGGGEREVLSTWFRDELLDAPMWARDLHEPDALPAPADADADTGGDVAPAAAGCSAAGQAGSAGSAGALAAALAGLALGRRRRVRS
ncbi:hypothetical protein WME79_22535 [Sorangium sp. So ce726]|uniref:hypothetical protein n=1 Tax=Sorangium sp. So ce726 TaxID=3133319 RepID=UPI003F60BDF3